MSSPRALPNAMKAFRIGDPDGAYPIWDPGGARVASGRWHEAGAKVIYASKHYSTAMLEKLVHYEGELPPNQHFLEIDIPAGIQYEVVNVDHIDGWAAQYSESARNFGREWYQAKSSAILIVPSVVARVEQNIVFNTMHEDFQKITISLEKPVFWDGRLFSEK